MFDIVGTPYGFPPRPPQTFDCWALLVWVREQLGLETPVHLDDAGIAAANADLTRLNQAVAKEKLFWTQVDKPQDGDAVLFDAGHIGVALGAGVLHAHAPHGAVVFTRWPVIRRRWPFAEVWRP